MHGPTAHSGVHQGSTIPCVINRQPHFIKRTRSVSCAPRYSPRPQRPAFWRCWTRTPVHSPACPPWYLGHLCRSDQQAGRQAAISHGCPRGELVHVCSGGPLERRARQSSSSRRSGVGAAGRERSVHAGTQARRRCGATTAPSFSTTHPSFSALSCNMRLASSACAAAPFAAASASACLRVYCRHPAHAV
jgi:hypothetical protein